MTAARPPLTSPFSPSSSSPFSPSAPSSSCAAPGCKSPFGRPCKHCTGPVTRRRAQPVGPQRNARAARRAARPSPAGVLLPLAFRGGAPCRAESLFLLFHESLIFVSIFHHHRRKGSCSPSGPGKRRVHRPAAHQRCRRAETAQQ